MNYKEYNIVLLNKIENAIQIQKQENCKEVQLSLTKRELQFIKIWVKTAYFNEDMLDDALGLK